MARLLRLALGLALSMALMGSRCGDVEAVPVEALRQDVAPSFDYGLYSDARGRLEGERSAVLLVHRSEHLERVYTDAAAGQARARVLVRQLEEATEAAGVGLADRALSLGCAALPTCTVRWAELETVIPSRGPGGTRLRRALARGFEMQARRERMEGAVVTAALNVLLVGGVMMAVEAKAAAGEARAVGAEAKYLASAAPVEARWVLSELEGALSLEEAAAVEARLVEAEALEVGSRLPARLEELARHRPSVEKPPPGVATGHPVWAEYVEYWERRYDELAGLRRRPVEWGPAKPPLQWPGYQVFRGRMRQALEFQREVAETLRQEAGLPVGTRTWLKELTRPRVDQNVGLAHGKTATLTYVDQFVVDEASLRPGVQPSVHSFSNKQRDFRVMNTQQSRDCLMMDAQEAQKKYGGAVEVRRPEHPLFGRDVVVSRVYVVYDDALMSADARGLAETIAEKYNVDFLFHIKR